MKIKLSYPSRRHGPPIAIPLCFVASEAYQGRFLLCCLHSFGNRGEAEVRRHTDYSPDDRGVTNLPVHMRNETLIDLQTSQRVFLQQAQRSEACAEVVKRDPDP